jgi:hypothetical protein
LIVGDLGRGFLLLSLPLAAVAARLNGPQLYVVALLVGVLTVFFDLSFQAFLPALVAILGVGGCVAPQHPA